MKTKIRVLFWGTLLLAVLAISPLRLVKVTGRSMEPTLRDGSTYVLDQFYWRFSGLRRMDVVVLDRGEEKWIKRVIGLPGDRLQILWRSDGWIVQVRNVVSGRITPLPGTQLEERQVGRDEIFVVGDNLNLSTDSTTQEAGSFRLEAITGVVRTFSFHREIPPAHPQPATQERSD